MEKEKKKKTLTISSNLTKKIDKSFISTDGKKSFFVEKKKSFKSNKGPRRTQPPGQIIDPELKKKNFARKFIEQQTTKDFIKKENKPAGKSKLK